MGKYNIGELMAEDSGQEVPPPALQSKYNIKELMQEDDAALRQSNVYEASFTNPDDVAKRQRVAKDLQNELGDATPPDLVDLQDANRRIMQSRANSATGKTAEFLANPDNAKIGIDDTETLQNIEKYLRDGLVSGRAARGVIGGAKYIGPDVQSLPGRDAPWSGLAKRGVLSGFWGANEGIAGAAAAPFEVAVSGFDRAMAGSPLSNRMAESSLSTIFARKYLSSVGSLFRDMATAASSQTAAIDAPVPVGNREAGVTSGVQSLTQNLITLPAGAATKSYKAFAGLMAGIAGGQSYIEATGKGLDPAAASLYATADAGAEYLTEVYAGKALFDIPGVKAGAKAILKGAANFATKEIISEEIATVWQDFNKWMALNPEKTLDDFIDERPDAFIQTAIATIVGGGGQIALMTSVNSLVEKGQKAQGAERLSSDLTALNMLIRSSKVLERNADAGQTFFQSVLEEYGDAADVWISPRALAETGLADQLSAIPEVKEQLGVVGNHDIRIPVASLLAKMGEQDVNVLAPLVSDEPGGMNSIDAKEYYQSGAAAELQAVVETYLKGKNDESVFRQSQDNVKAQILDEMNATGRWTSDKNEKEATLLSSYYAVRAAQSGVTPEQLYARRRVRFGAENVVGPSFSQNAQLGREAARSYRGLSSIIKQVQKGKIDPGTIAHESTSAAVASMLAKELKLSKSRTADITLAALAHDVGKSAIPTDVLLADRPLTDQEFAKIKEHPEIGHKMLKDAGIPDSISEIVLHHHRGYKEGGYPAATQDEYLTFGSQILHVADVVSAIGKKDAGHPYVESAGLEKAIAVLRDSEKFNQEIVDAFANLVKQNRIPRAFKQEQQLFQKGSNPQTETEAFKKWFSPSPTQLLDGLPVSVVSALERNTNALSDFLESQSGLSESDRFQVIPSTVFAHMAGVVDNPKILDAVVRSLPVDVMNFLAGKQGSAKNVLHDEAMLKNVFSANPASDVSLGVNPSGIAELTVRLVANAGAKISGVTSGALDRNAAMLADENDPILGAHVRKSSSGDLSIIAGFGDSKVVDAEGKPLVVYHGTADNFDTFDASKDSTKKDHGYLGRGFYFSTSTATASSYANMKGGMADPNVMPVYLSLQTPLKLSMTMRDTKIGLIRHALGLPYNLSYENVTPTAAQEVTDRLRELGHDGVILDYSVFSKNGNPAEKEVVAFNPEQIKSAIGNKGTFDPASPNILYQSAFHGSPHKFDKFTLDHIGRGEGAQAYGWGLYFAGNKEVAEYYRKTLARGKIRVDGVEFTPSNYSINEMIGLHKGSNAELSAMLRSYAKENAGNPFAGIEDATKIADAIDENKFERASEGQLYEVDIPDDGQYLLFDEPLSRQPKNVREALTQAGFLDNRQQVEEFSDALLSALQSPGITEIPKQPSDPSGERIYRKLEAQFSSDEAASKYLNSLGIAGIKYLDGSSRSKGKGEYNYVIFDESAIKVLQTFYQQNNAAFSPETLTITALKGANLSSVLHESAHFFFENDIFLASELIGKPDITEGEQQIISDVSILLAWHGIKGLPESQLRQWASMSFEEQQAHHERTAESFEKYLFDGKAPSIELQPYFQKFREWMTSVYKTIKNFLANNPEAGKLNDEVRGVFDRMLATEEQIQLAEQGRSMMPLFTDQKKSGMTPELFAAYQKQAQAGTNEAIDTLQAQGMKDMQWLHNFHGRMVKKLQKEARAKRAEVEMEVRREVMSMPIYRAWQFLTGKIDEEGTAGRFDIKAVEEMGYPVEFVNHLKTLKMTSKDGLNPDVVADLIRNEDGSSAFSSADELIRTLLAVDSPRDAINKMTDARMLAENGELATDEAIERAADVAIYNEARGKFIASEANALNAALGNRKILIPAVKEYAAQVISGLKVRNIRPSQYTGSSVRAAKLAQKASEKGDIQTAATEKVNQLIGHYAAKAAYEAQDDVDRIVKHFKKIQKPSAQKNMRGEYLVQANNLLARFDLRQKTEGEAQKLEDWINSTSENLSAVVPDIPAWVLNESYVKNYKDLTVEELRGLDSSIRQLEHLARREQKMYKEVRSQNYQQEVSGILDELKSVHPEAFNDEGPIKYRKDALPLVKEMAGRLKSKFDGEFMNVENLLDIMTRGKGDKVFASLFGRISEAADYRSAFMKKLGGYLGKATKAYSVKERIAMTLEKRLVPGTGRYMTREQRISVALFNGSEEGRQRLTEGNGLNQYDIQKIIDTLDEKDVNLLKAMWSMSDEMIWPELAALNERTAGIAPVKVKAVPFQTKFGEVPGGYVPLVYDGDMDSRAHDLNTNSSVQELLGGSMTVAATQRSASKERLAKVNRPLDLSLRAMASKINETVHDIAFREAIADTYRLLQNTELSDAIRTISGPDAYKAMVMHIREAAVKPRTPSGFMEKSFWYLRKNTLINMMGASVQTVAINVLGVIPSIRRVGPARFIRALGKLTTQNPIQTYKGVLDKSMYMRERLTSFDRDMSEELSKFSIGGVMPTMNFWFAGLSIMDRSITIPTWIAAYEQGMEELNNNEDAAVAFADRVIRQTQGSGRVVDLAKIAGGVGPAGEFKRIFTMYYNFFNAQLGSLRRGHAIAAREASEGRYAKAAMTLTLDALAIVILPAVLEAIARGNCGDDPEAEDYMYCTVRSSAMFSASFFPLFRDVLPYAWRQFDPEFKGGYAVRMTPVQNAIETAGRVPKSVVDVINDEETDQDYKTLIQGAGYLFGLPGFQAWRTLDGYRALSEGETDKASALLFGKPKD